MASSDETSVRRRSRRRRPDPVDGEPAQPSSGVAPWLLLGMALISLGCLLGGAYKHGFDWKITLQAGGCLAAGIAFVAIGLLELEWLERIVGFVEGIYSFLVQWWWTTWSGSLSDNELV